MIDESQARQNLAKKKRYGAPSTRVLVLSVLGLIVCQLFSPVAWYVGHQETQGDPQRDVLLTRMRELPRWG